MLDADPGRTCHRDTKSSGECQREPLHAALRVGAEGLCALEAGTGLIIAGGTWTGRPDFACHIHYSTTAAAIDWEAAIAARDAGGLLCSGGEKRMLRLAASLAADIPVRLGDAVTGIDRHSVGLLLEAIHHASGEPKGCGKPSW